MRGLKSICLCVSLTFDHLILNGLLDNSEINRTSSAKSSEQVRFISSKSKSKSKSKSFSLTQQTKRLNK